MTDPVAVEPPSRSDWLVWRRSGIGASDVAAIVSLSPWASPYSVWADKVGLAPDEPDNDFKEFGRRAESMLDDYFEDRNPGLLAVDQQALVVHPDHNHHRATLDGRVVDHPDGSPLGVLEKKTAERGTESLWEEGVPDQYACQVQWQMYVDQADHAWMAVLHGRKYRTYEVDRDQRAIAMLVERVDQFWEKYVLTGDPPPADGHDATRRAIAAAYPAEVEGKRANLDDLRWAIDLRAEGKRKISDGKADVARAENHIKAAIGDAELGCIEGEPVFAYRQRHRDGYTVKPKDYRELRAIGGAK